MSRHAARTRALAYSGRPRAPRSLRLPAKKGSPTHVFSGRPRPLALAQARLDRFCSDNRAAETARALELTQQAAHKEREPRGHVRDPDSGSARRCTQPPGSALRNSRRRTRVETAVRIAHGYSCTCATAVQCHVPNRPFELEAQPLRKKAALQRRQAKLKVRQQVDEKNKDYGGAPRLLLMFSITKHSVFSGRFADLARTPSYAHACLFLAFAGWSVITPRAQRHCRTAPTAGSFPHV